MLFKIEILYIDLKICAIEETKEVFSGVKIKICRFRGDKVGGAN